MPAPLEIKVISINSSAWTPIVVPFDCSSISLRNAAQTNPIRMRTTSTDASTEDTLGPGREQAFAVPFHRYRFLTRSQPVWLQSVDADAPVVVKFLA
jgi:hypothetical protein